MAGNGGYDESSGLSDSFFFSAIIVFVIIFFASAAEYAALGMVLSGAKWCFLCRCFFLTNSLMASFAYRALLTEVALPEMENYNSWALTGVLISNVVVVGTFAKFSIIPFFDVTPDAEVMRLKLSLLMLIGAVVMWGLVSYRPVIMNATNNVLRQYASK
jgi:hypothetical protein